MISQLFSHVTIVGVGGFSVVSRQDNSSSAVDQDAALQQSYS